MAEDDGGQAAVEALQRHQALTPSVIQRGQASEIKKLYADLGEDLWLAAQDDPDAVPVLSAPETTPAVVKLMDRSGLLLDAGCGPNPAASIALAARPGTVVIGMDYGFGTARTARAVAARRKAVLHAVCADLEKLPFRDGAFDGLICDDTIEHLPDDRQGVAEIARTLRPGGLAVIATPNRRRADVLLRRARHLIRGHRLPGSDYFAASSHLREYTWEQGSRLVERHLDVRRQLTLGWSSPSRLRHLNRLLSYPGLERFGQMLVYVAVRRNPG